MCFLNYLEIIVLSRGKHNTDKGKAFILESNAYSNFKGIQTWKAHSQHPVRGVTPKPNTHMCYTIQKTLVPHAPHNPNIAHTLWLLPLHTFHAKTQNIPYDGKNLSVPQKRGYKRPQKRQKGQGKKRDQKQFERLNTHQKTHKDKNGPKGPNFHNPPISHMQSLGTNAPGSPYDEGVQPRGEKGGIVPRRVVFAGMSKEASRGY